MDQGPAIEQLERILKSRAFQGKAQLRQLLTLLVNNIDRQSSLKPDRIIHELWADEADAKTSADLAPAVTRLRKALKSYYAGEGRNDPIIISLPDRSLRTLSGAKPHWVLCTARTADQESQASPRQIKALNAAELQLNSPSSEASQRGQLWPWLGLAILLILVLIVNLRVWSRLSNEPKATRLDGNTMTVVDARGRALWSKAFADGFWTDYYKGNFASRTWIGDLDGDGNLSVLLVYHPAVQPYEHSSALICYSARGKEKWRWIPGRPLPELRGSPPTFFIRGFIVLNGTAGKPARIVLVSPHEPLDPSQVALIDNHGRTISEYWHSGHLDFATPAKLDDGRQFIVATGVSNGYEQATLIVLDPDQISGASVEKNSAEQIHGMGLARERFRVLFPRSDLNVATHSYNAGLVPIAGADGLRIPVRECDLNPDCRIWYEFNKKLELRSVYPDDRFRDAHREFFGSGGHSHGLTFAEEAEFRKVRCLEGCRGKFVPSVP